MHIIRLSGLNSLKPDRFQFCISISHISIKRLTSLHGGSGKVTLVHTSTSSSIYLVSCVWHEVLMHVMMCNGGKKNKTIPLLPSRPQPSRTQHLRPTWQPTVHLLWASARWRNRPRTSSSGSSSVGLALCMVGQLGTSMLWQPRWCWLTEPCESVWSDFSDAGYSQPMQGKERDGKRERE